MMKTSEAPNAFSVCTAATGSEVKLVMQELMLTGRILPVGSSLLVRHLFQSAEPNPVEVVYSFALPRDAAMRRFRIVGKGFSIASDLKPTKEATRLYEQGIEAGRLSTLARQYRDGVVNLNVGNVRPGETVAVYLEILAGVELHDDGLRFRFPFALSPTYHPQARSIEAEPGVGEMELPKEFEDVILPRWMKEATGLHRIGFDLAVAFPQQIAEIGSPSHSIKVRHESDGCHRVTLADHQDVPNRDLVLDVRTAQPVSGVTGGLAKDGTGHFAVVVPSTAFGKTERAPKRIVFVLDRSGSMSGLPITQAKQALAACLGALSDRDAFGIVAFDDTAEHLELQLLTASKENRRRAQQFLDSVDARGGTELAQGFLAAAQILGKQDGDVLVLTDGQVSGTETILSKARSAGIRIHCLGIGSASQDRFLTLLARETGGVSRFLTPREAVHTATIDLFASIGSPVARDFRAEAEGVEFAPPPPPAIFAGTPLLLFGECAKKTKPSMRLSWEGGKLEIPLKLAPSDDAEAVRLLQGARLITDMEARMETESTHRAVGRREQERQMKALEKLSTRYGLASRAMSLVAVVKRKGDKPGEVPQTVVVPVGLPQDTAFAAYFEAGAPPMQAKPAVRLYAPEPPVLPSDMLTEELSQCEQYHLRAEDNLLLELAALIEPDGGLPGKDDAERWVATAAALLYFVAEGHTAHSGAFRAHVQRLLEFLRSAPSTATDARKRRLVELAERGTALRGDWRKFAETLVRRQAVSHEEFWREFERALAILP